MAPYVKLAKQIHKPSTKIITGPILQTAKVQSRPCSYGVRADLESPVTDTNDEKRLLKFLPHVAKYQRDMFENKGTPVPPLEKTLDKYVSVLSPVINKKELEHAKKVLEDMKHDSVLHKCQHYIETKAASTDNWLADWWLDVAYLAFRESVVVNVTPASVEDVGAFPSSEAWAEYAAKLVHSLCNTIAYTESEEFVKTQRREAEKSGDGQGPCLIQYYRLFNSCRVPLPASDGYVMYPPGSPKGPTHIVVMYRNQMYAIDVLDKNKKPFSASNIYQKLLNIIQNSSTQDSSAKTPFGALTALHRDEWAKYYDMLASDANNSQVLKSIESSIFLLCLDEADAKSNSLTNASERLTDFANLSLHGGGTDRHSCNRWWDKTMQVVLNSCGLLSVPQEHSTAEAVVPVQLTSVAVKHLSNVVMSSKDIVVDKSEADKTVEVFPLKFNVNNPELLTGIEAGKRTLDRTVDILDMKAVDFSDFGKDMIKLFKVSPDAFFQVALQFSMFRFRLNEDGNSIDEQLLLPTYESGSLRNFRWGRTDTIRSATPESLKFARAFCKSGIKDPSLETLLRSAIAAHSKYTKEVMRMEGVDRHLLGLKLAFNELQLQDHSLELPQIFKEHFHNYCSNILLSTSQVSVSENTFVCFGPTSFDCTGVCYSIGTSGIKFMVSSFKESEYTNSEKFATYVKESLKIMRTIFDTHSRDGAKTLSKL